MEEREENPDDSEGDDQKERAPEDQLDAAENQPPLVTARSTERGERGVKSNFPAFSSRRFRTTASTATPGT